MSAQVLELVSPVFLVILTGFIMSRVFPIFKPDAADILIRFSFYVAVPALLIYSLTKTPIERIFHVRYLAIYGGTTLFAFVLMLLVSRFLTHRNLAQSTIIGALCSLTNMGFIGLPLTLALLGQSAVAPATMAILALVIFFYPLTIILINFDNGNDVKLATRLLQVSKEIITNPIILPAIVGTILSIFAISPPKFIDSYFAILQNALTPCALFAIGLSIEFDKIKDNIVGISFITLIKLIALPAFALLLCNFFEIQPLYTVMTVIAVAVPPAKSVFVIANKYGLLPKEAAATISFATMLSMGTLFAWIFILAHLYPSLFFIK